MSSNSATKKVTLNLLTFLIPSFVTMFLGMARMSVLVSVLEPEAFNVFSSINNIVMSIYIIEAGLSGVFVKYLYNDIKNDRNIDEKRQKTRNVLLFIGISVFVFLSIFTFTLTNNTQLIIAGLIHSLSVLLVIASIYYSLILFAAEKRPFANIIWNSQQFIIITLDIIIIIVTKNLMIAAIVTIILRLIAAILLGRKVSKLNNSNGVAVQNDKFEEDLGFSITSSIVDFGFENMPLILLSVISEPSMLLIYNFTKPIYSIVKHIATTITNSFRDILSVFSVEKKNYEKSVIFANQQAILAALQVAMIASLSMVFIPLAKFVSGGNINLSSEILFFLGLFYFVNITRFGIRGLRDSIGAFTKGLKIDSINLITSTMLALLFYRTLGGIGVIFGFILSSLTIEFILYPFVFKGVNSEMKKRKFMSIYFINFVILVAILMFVSASQMLMVSGGLIEIIITGGAVFGIIFLITLLINILLFVRVINKKGDSSNE